MAKSMRTAWRHFRVPPTHFQSRDVINVIFGKTLFLRRHVKTKIMANGMRTAWRHFRAPPTHFRSRDVINAIFGITAITPLFFKLKTSSKN